MGERSRERRVCSAKFKVGALRRAEERRAAGVSLTQVARELDAALLLGPPRRSAGEECPGR